MKMMRLLAVLLIGLGFLACDKETKLEHKEGTWLVASFTKKCQAVGEHDCLQVKYEPNQKDWHNHYFGIEGFDYEPGYEYVLRVKTTPVPENEVMMDGSSERHELLEIVQKVKK